MKLAQITHIDRLQVSVGLTLGLVSMLNCFLNTVMFLAGSILAMSAKVLPKFLASNNSLQQQSKLMRWMLTDPVLDV